MRVYQRRRLAGSGSYLCYIFRRRTIVIGQKDPARQHEVKDRVPEIGSPQRPVGVEDRIELRLGPALDTLDRMIASGESGTFDFAFIDADKTNYANYFERALRLLRKGGVIAVDNVLWDGSVVDGSDNSADTQAIREFNRKLHDDSRVAISMVTIGDGITVACKL